MTKTLSILIVSALVLSSCGTIRESRFNPFNWFGRAQSQPVATDSDVNPLLPRRRASIFRQEQQPYGGQPVSQVTEMAIERRPGGAILRVTGLTDRVGAFDVRLVPDEDTAPDTSSFTLRALQQAGPRDPRPVTREVTAAIWLTDQQLAGIRTLRVAGRENAQVSRR